MPILTTQLTAHPAQIEKENVLLQQEKTKFAAQLTAQIPQQNEECFVLLQQELESKKKEIQLLQQKFDQIEKATLPISLSNVELSKENEKLKEENRNLKKENKKLKNKKQTKAKAYKSLTKMASALDLMANSHVDSDTDVSSQSQARKKINSLLKTIDQHADVINKLEVENRAMKAKNEVLEQMSRQAVKTLASNDLGDDAENSICENENKQICSPKIDSTDHPEQMAFLGPLLDEINNLIQKYTATRKDQDDLERLVKSLTNESKCKRSAFNAGRAFQRLTSKKKISALEDTLREHEAMRKNYSAIRDQLLVLEIENKKLQIANFNNNCPSNCDLPQKNFKFVVKFQQ